jgi:hypothetical protein
MSDNNLAISSPAQSRRSSVSSSSLQSSVETHDDGSMPLPPEGYFLSFEALETYAQNHAQHHGYAVVFIQ